MIVVETKRKENFISYIKIDGHSGYKKEGSDIICSSVSSIAITTVNAIERLDSKAITYSEDDGLLIINVLKNDKVVNTLIDNMISLFEELERKYNKYIKIR